MKGRIGKKKAICDIAKQSRFIPRYCFIEIAIVNSAWQRQRHIHKRDDQNCARHLRSSLIAIFQNGWHAALSNGRSCQLLVTSVEASGLPNDERIENDE